MKRFHVHLGVSDLAAGIRFHTGLFGQPPAIEKPDYAKWMLDDPRVNFAISHAETGAGLQHLGFQAESADELAGIRARFAAADAAAVSDELDVTCCYARGNKHWTRDPQGVAWEAFQTLETDPARERSESRVHIATEAPAAQCCNPKAAAPSGRSACCA